MVRLPSKRRTSRRHRPATTAALAAVAALLVSTAAQPAALEDDIAFLLEQVTSSDCTFVRNGKDHTGAEAARHMDRKYRHFRDEIGSVAQFIEKAATRSLMSGKAYTVRCPGEPETRTAVWLRNLLDRSID